MFSPQFAGGVPQKGRIKLSALERKGKKGGKIAMSSQKEKEDGRRRCIIGVWRVSAAEACPISFRRGKKMGKKEGHDYCDLVSQEREAIKQS